jgi:Ribonuclease G/E
VTDRDDEGGVTVERTIASSGVYDGLGVDREAGDTATSSFEEGRWWYPTVYRSEAGDVKGTYVNVCTPVECFPRTVAYVDLHVDVVKVDGEIRRVDDDDLDRAVENGTVPAALAEKARAVATAIADGLS